MFFPLLLLAHFQAVIIPIILGIKSINNFKKIRNNHLIPFGFFSLGLASLFETIDHTQTAWIYINHSSFFNWLFYSFLTLGLTTLSISVLKNKFYIGINLLLSIFSISSYLFFGKNISLIFQVIISIFLIINWQKIFKDWILILYPIFGIFFTTFFGTNLSVSGDQIWHVFIGPSGTISVLAFYLILKRFDNNK